MSWILKRLATSLVLLWAVATLLFLAIYLVPGDPAEILLSYGGTAPDPQQVELLREKLGLNAPLLTQYLAQMRGLVQGDFGVSLQDGASIGSEIARRLPRTLELILAAALIAVVVGIPLGMLSALRPGSLVDRLCGWLAGVAISVPVFVIGTLLLLVFAQILKVLPGGGFVEFAEDPARHLQLLILPACTVAAGLMASVLRMTRASVLDTLPLDHVRAARARGLTPLRTLLRHVLRNAMTPVVTLLALNMGTLLGGTVLVEYVFNWPGMSGFLVSAVSARDYPAVVAIVLVTASIFILLNLLVDLAYSVLDPRTASK